MQQELASCDTQIAHDKPYVSMQRVLQNGFGYMYTCV